MLNLQPHARLPQDWRTHARWAHAHSVLSRMRIDPQTPLPAQAQLAGGAAIVIQDKLAGLLHLSHPTAQQEPRTLQLGHSWAAQLAPQDQRTRQAIITTIIRDQRPILRQRRHSLNIRAISYAPTLPPDLTLSLSAYLVQLSHGRWSPAGDPPPWAPLDAPLVMMLLALGFTPDDQRAALRLSLDA